MTNRAISSTCARMLKRRARLGHDWAEMSKPGPRQDVTQLPLIPVALPSLNEQLAAAGYTTAPADNGQKHILRDGRVVFTGRAHEMAAWLAADALPW